MNTCTACPLIVAILMTLFSSSASAEFRKTGELIQPAQLAPWISRVDDGWFLSHDSYISRTDDNFESQQTLGPYSGVRGLDWDPTRNLLFVSVFADNAVRYYTPDGDYAGQFPTQGSVNDIAVDASSGDIWLLYHSKRVQRVNFNGEVLSSFETPFYLSGLTVAPETETLLIMRSADPFLASDPLSDEIYEFDYGGNNLGLQVAAGSFAGGDGQGLEYDPATNVLYASGASDRILMFQRVPEPGGALLMITALAILSRCHRPRGRVSDDGCE